MDDRAAKIGSTAQVKGPFAHKIGSVEFAFPDFLSIHKRIPSLDGWRAISIALVMIAHGYDVVGFPSETGSVWRWLPSGTFGVEVFFVISGFLITYLLLKEVDRTGTISIRQFYLRRIFRIMPPFILFIVTIFLLTIATPLAISGRDWAHVLTFT